MMKKTVFVTVGSTSFDKLSLAVLDSQFQESIRQAGFTRLVLQHGRSGKTLARASSPKGLQVETFEYAPNLQEYISQADLIISHAGAGSIIEALKAGKDLIVVANEDLMDNHQLELAERLSADGYCTSATPNTLLKVLAAHQTRERKMLSQSDGKALGSIFKQELDALRAAE